MRIRRKPKPAPVTMANFAGDTSQRFSAWMTYDVLGRIWRRPWYVRFWRWATAWEIVE